MLQPSFHTFCTCTSMNAHPDFCNPFYREFPPRSKVYVPIANYGNVCHVNYNTFMHVQYICRKHFETLFMTRFFFGTKFLVIWPRNYLTSLATIYY